MKEEFPKPNLNPGENMEKIKTTNVNLVVIGALSKFRGFGDNIASSYDKNEIQQDKFVEIIRTISDFDKIYNQNSEKNESSCGFVFQKSGRIFFSENYPRYTKFPEQNRFYRQTFYSWADAESQQGQDVGKVFQAIKPFKQYDENEYGKQKYETTYKETDEIIPKKLIDSLMEILKDNNSERKLIIYAFLPEGGQLLGEEALEYEPVKKVLLAFDELPPDQRKNFSLYFGDTRRENARVLIMFKKPELSNFEKYYRDRDAIIVSWKDLTE